MEQYDLPCFLSLFPPLASAACTDTHTVSMHNVSFCVSLKALSHALVFMHIAVSLVCNFGAVVYELWMISVLQDTFPCIYSGLYGLTLQCIYSMYKNCRAVCIYNNTACSNCVCALDNCLHVAGHRFMCWSVIGPCLSAPFFQRRLPPR